MDALVHAGTDLNVTSTSFRLSPLQLAVHQEQWDIALKLLERGADPSIRTYVGASPIQKAAYKANIDLVQFIAPALRKVRYSAPKPEVANLSSAPLLNVKPDVHIIEDAVTSPLSRIKHHTPQNPPFILPWRITLGIGGGIIMMLMYEG